MRFTAIDVETANPDYSSICQIGLALFEDGKVTKTFSCLVNPEDYFDPWNVSCHGIEEDDVIDAKTFPDILPIINEFVGDTIVVHHTAFDKVAITRASEKYGLGLPQFAWLDSARVARRAWEKFACSGYRLSNICMEFNVKYKAHDALEDAIAAGKILTKAIKDTGISLDDWTIRSLKPINPSARIIKFSGNPAGTLFGENVVFTGTLSMPRREIAKIAADAGCNVSDGVNKNTTILVLGMQDIKRLAGNDRSAKYRKVLALIEKGADIKIISEDDLVAMISL